MRGPVAKFRQDRDLLYVGLGLGRVLHPDDVAAGAVSFRYRDGSQRNGVALDEAVAEILDAVHERRQVESALS